MTKHVNNNTPLTLAFERKDPKLLDLLKSSKIERNGKNYFARTKSVDDDGIVHIELLPLESFSRIKSYLKSLRAISLTATLTPWLATYLFTLKLNKTTDIPLWWSLIAILLLQVAVNVWNDWSDHLKSIDAPSRFGGSGVLQEGSVSPQALRVFGHVCFALAFFIGIYHLSLVPALIPYMIAGLIIGLGYSLFKGGLKYNALGDIAVFWGCGPGLTIPLGIIATGEVVPELLWIGSFFGFMANTILHVNNLQDIEVDQASGVKTLALVLGRKASIFLLFFFYVMAIGSLVFFYFESRLDLGLLHIILFGVISLLVLKNFISVAKIRDFHDEKFRLIRVDASKLHLLTGILFCVGLAFVKIQ